MNHFITIEDSSKEEIKDLIEDAKYFKQNILDQYARWIVDEEKMGLTNDAYFSNCLPVKRNIIVSDKVIDSDKSLVYDEAENRLHVQKAIINKLLEEKNE